VSIYVGLIFGRIILPGYSGQLAGAHPGIYKHSPNLKSQLRPWPPLSGLNTTVYTCTVGWFQHGWMVFTLLIV
jgi:hypothetical protein